MKKLICVVLAGAVIMGACACNKNDTPKHTKDNDSSVEETVEDEEKDEADKTNKTEEATEVKEATETKAPAETTSSNYEDNYWFVDPTDEATVKKLVDDVIACEPKLNDTMYNNDNVVGKRVGTTFDHMFSEFSLMSFGYQFYFEYGSDKRTEIINGRDHVRFVAYNGFDLESVGHLEFKVNGYKESYTHSERPGSGTVALYVYDEKEANACKDIFVNYIKELYKDEIVGETTFESLNGIYLLYGEKQTERLAEVWCRPVEDVEGCWQVSAIITFNDADMMPKA